MKVEQENNNKLVISRNNIVLIILALIAVLVVGFLARDEPLALIVGVAIILAILFAPFKETVIVDKVANLLEVKNRSIVRKSKRSIELDKISKLKLEIIRNMQVNFANSRNRRRNSVRVLFYALLNEKAKGELQFSLPAPRVSTFFSSSLFSMFFKAKINEYEVLEKLASHIGVPLEKSEPQSPANMMSSFMQGNNPNNKI